MFWIGTISIISYYTFYKLVDLKYFKICSMLVGSGPSA